MHNRLKQIRKEKILTQKEMGKKLGVSRDTISNIEIGRVKPNDLFVNHFCREFNVNREWLISGVGSKYSDIDEKYIGILSEEDNTIAEIFASITVGEDEKLKDLIKKISNLDEEYIDLISKLVDGLIK